MIMEFYHGSALGASDFKEHALDYYSDLQDNLAKR